jgi:FkbM family methyltransferase
MPSALSRARKLGDPAAVRVALMRRTLSTLLRRAADPAGVRLERLGSDYGGWTVPVDRIDEDWTVWSLGTGHDASFDVEILNRYPKSTVRAFDPFTRNLAGAAERSGNNPRYSQHHLAIAATDGPITLTGSPDPDVGSVAAPVPGHDEPTFTVPGRSIPSLKAELGDASIDLLKMDIEGAEFDVLSSLDLTSLGVQVLCAELHFNVSLSRARSVVDHVRSQGFRLVACDDTDVTFVRAG